ncbi:MAG: GspH/FimT family pseudopilin [Pseudomonadota bacterium]
MSIRAKRQQGFSLLETLIALAIIASLVSLAAVAVRPSAGPAAVRADANEIAAALRRVRTHAIATGAPADYSLNIATREHEILDKSRSLRRDIDIRATVAERFREDGGVIGIRFYPNGASSGGEISLSAGAAQSVVRVDWMTGRVSTQEARDDT